MILPSEKSATDVAAQCFLNALIRETKDWQLAEYPPDELIIPLDEQKSLHFRVAYFSPTQHHRFAFPAHLVTASGSYPVDFTTLSRLIIDKLRHQLFLPVPLCETFHQRVLESYAHTQQTIDARHDWAILREKALNFGEAEQALLTGHAFHPAPKSHEPFNRQEAERYLPDMAPHFPLRWFSVDKTQIAGESLHLNLQQRLTRFAAENAPQLLNELSDNQWLFPLHPWQGEYLLQQVWCQALFAKGLIRDLGEAGTSWLPTTSSRSLYCATSRDMIKFSLSVRLTNSVRTLSVKEVERGMRLARLAQTDGWQMLQARFPTFRVMQEDGWAGLRDLNGNIMQESLFSLRENLLLEQPQSQTNVLVSLTQAAPDGGDSLLVSAVKRLSDRLGITVQQAAHAWVDAYCQQVLKPLFTAEADYGLVLLAHQQNILVQMLGDLPVGFIYRDCQGSAFMPHATEWLDTIDEAQAENIFTREQLLRYFPYYLLVNSTFAVTAALGGADLFLNALRGEWGEAAEINWVSRRNNFNALDEAAFADEYFTPEYISGFSGLEEDIRHQLLDEQKMTSDGITADSLLTIYRELYHRFEVLRKPRNIRLLPSRSVTTLESSGPGWKLLMEHHLDQGRESLESDVVIFATGYRSALPQILPSLMPLITMHDKNTFKVRDDFTLEWSGPKENNIFVVNASMQTHGIAEPQLSLMAWRSARILNRVMGRDLFDLSMPPALIQWRSGT
ncbi:TPA: SidA/IucD/PvdA family monooxygenase [Escherichia coli]|nr:SidA/IucD/PvdA family monooxygenase [Escherichia coli]HAW4311955.1 SidA/IucD/PvdA family monooxygenase [Escherichia coli]HBB4167386.1 SidA/IucD/PvdA family monooxygenase [Escherichia coli]HBB4232698.1 SidA/IucD/PvdA family monooxygenase [Escherichia coli]HBC8259919.1 SidA/IucD/PvdA family monooxygenase [Escherichia coli]